VRRFWIALVTSAVTACGGSAPAPPVVNPPATGQTINGSERLGWDQPAADAAELATIGYAIYADGNRTEAAGVTCATTATAAGFACTARLPPLTPGAHTLQIASFVNDGGLLESARSTPLPVTVVATTVERSANGVAPRENDTERRAKASVEPRLELVADRLEDVADLAFAPDGRLFVAERAGSIRAIPAIRRRPPVRDDAPAALDLRGRAELLALAVDPQFTRTHFVFAIYTEHDGDGAATFTLARFREAGGTLADAAVLLDRIRAATPPRAALRFGADDRLYAAFDAGGDVQRSDDLASLNGKVLRLNADGTTPRDQRSATPVVSSGLVAPAGLAWIAGSRDPWVIDRRGDGSAQLREIGGNQRAFRLPDGVTPSSVAGTLLGDLLIGSADGGALLRVRFDAADGKPIGTELVTLTEIDGIRALAAVPDGALYVATPTRIWRVGGEM
jgi:glucose/arabinose dehydrogenase